jgi:hypothetical protein
MTLIYSAHQGARITVQYGKVPRNSISVPLGVLDHAEESAQPSHRFNVIDDLEASNRFCLYVRGPIKGCSKSTFINRLLD